MDHSIVSADLLRYGEQYLEASDAVHQTLTSQPRYRGCPPLPTLKLIGGAFEMLLKAFLLERGETLKLLQSMDSDLERLRRRAMDIGLAQRVVFQGLEETAIDFLGYQLVNRELAFQPFAASSPPPYFLLRTAAGRLAPVVRRDIEDGEAARAGQSSMVASSM